MVEYPGGVSPRNALGSFVINNSGLIVSDYFDINGREHGFAAIECPPSGRRQNQNSY
jgi:hypothetical protein